MTSTTQDDLILRRTRRRSRADLNRLLVNAVQDGDLAKLRALLKDGADPDVRNAQGEPVLLMAAYKPHGLRIVKELLKAGADVNAADRDKNCPLIVSVRDENLSVVRELVRQGANINARNSDGDTPLTNAACWGSERVVRFLLAHSANPNLRDGMNISAAELARQQGHTKIAALMQRHQKKLHS